MRSVAWYGLEVGYPILTNNNLFSIDGNLLPSKHQHHGRRIAPNTANWSSVYVTTMTLLASTFILL